MGNTLCEKLQKLQNRAARVITCSWYDTSSSSLLKELNWNTLSVNWIKQQVTLMHMTINKRTPLYLQVMFSPNEYVYNLRKN